MLIRQLLISITTTVFYVKGPSVKTIKTLMLLLTALALTACKQASITAPANNYVDDEVPPSFEVTFTGGQPADLSIQLNTTVVTDRFAVSSSGATASAVDLTDVIYSGRNVFRVKANNQIKQIYFYYDTEGPSIRITDTDHESNIVTGYVVDRGGIASVTLDGVALTLDANNGFSVPFTEQPVNTFVAADNFGHISETQFADRETDFSGISARLNQGGLNFLTDLLAHAIEDKELTDQLPQDPSMSLADLNLFGICIICIDFTIKELSIRSFEQFDLIVQDDERIDTQIDTRDVHVLLSTRLRFLALVIPVDFTTDATVDIARLRISTRILLDIINSDLDVDLRNTYANIDGLNIILHSIPNILFIDDLINRSISMIAGALIDLFTPLFTTLLDQIIIPIASDFIKDIPIDLALVTLDDGEKLNIRALPEFLDTYGRGITVDLATRIWAPEPPEGIAGALGSLYVPGDTPSLGAVDPDGMPFDFGASINANVINQAFLAAHEAGVTTMEIRPETYANATPEGIQVYAAGSEFGEGAKIGMRIEPVSAPYIKFMPSADGAPGKFGWSDVYLAFDLYKPEWGEYRTLFGVTFDLEVAFEVNATEDGFLSLGIEQLPTIFISKTDSSGMLLIPPAFINGTLDYFMPAVLPRLAAKLKAVPLPRIYNHTLHMNKFWIAGEGNNSLALVGDLIPIAVTEAAPAPSTVVDYETQDITVTQETVSANGVVTSKAVLVNNGEVIIDVDGVNPNAGLGLLEHRYRVDGGPWTIWKHRDTIRLTRLLAGTHSVEICARTVLLKREQGCPVVTFETSVE